MSIVTIKDIARQSGASISTVSHALNGREGAVSETRRQEILKVADRLGYRVNRRARQLRKKQNLIISVQLHSQILSSNVWRPTVGLNLLEIQGFSDYVCRRGYHLHLLIPSLGKDVQSIESQVISEDAVDGIVLMGLHDVDRASIRSLLVQLKKCRVPAVTMDLQCASCGVPIVSVDLHDALRTLVRTIRDRGHTHVGYVGIGHVVSHQSLQSRLEQFRQALASAGLELRDTYVRTANTETGAYQATLDMLDQPDRPTCVFYSSDHFAMAGMDAMKYRQLRIPDDISVVGIDNAPYAREYDIPLASIDQRLFDKGVMMGKMLLDQIESPNEPIASQTVIKATFADRQSLGRVPRF